jgi:hypothetical protein
MPQFADFVDFIKSHVLEWASIQNKTPYLCTRCNHIWFTKKETIDEKKKSFDMSFMVNLLAVFPRHGRLKTIDEYRLRFFCALKCEAHEVSQNMWPTLMIGGDSKRRYHHSCIKALEKQPKLSKAEIQLEHLKIMEMFGLRPKPIKADTYLERMFDLEVSCSKEDSWSLGKRDLEERSEPSLGTKILREPLHPEDFNLVIEGEELKKYDKVTIQFNDSEVDFETTSMKKVAFSSVYGRQVKY